MAEQAYALVLETSPGRVVGSLLTDALGGLLSGRKIQRLPGGLLQSAIYLGRKCVGDLCHFLTTYGLADKDVIVVPYGSRVYGTHKEDSDYDFLAILPDNRTGQEYLHHNINVHLYNRDDFQEQLQQHKVHALEAYFLKDSVVPAAFDFKLNLTKLRQEFSQKASNSFVKAKKKIDKEKDYYVGWKSLFHSLRILNFGIQIGLTGRIHDYGNANHYWRDIVTAGHYRWDYFKEKYQPEYNRLATEFRKLAPKEIEIKPQ